MKFLFIKRHHQSYNLSPNDFKIVAIHSNISPYLLAWCLDDTFSTNFVCEPKTFEINLSKNRLSQHIEYYFEGSETLSHMWILQNSGTNGKIISGKPSPDYWLIIGDSELMPSFDQWLNKLKSIDKIQMAYVYPEHLSEKFNWVYMLSHL